MSASPSDPVLEELLTRCLTAIETDGVGAVDRICDEHPDRARALRRQLALLDGFGLVDEVQARIPERIGRYRVLERLGSGGMGLVYGAVDEELGREVAIKLLRPDGALFDDRRERFDREIRAIARLSHHGIVSLLDWGEHDRVPFLVMPRIRGVSGAELLAATHAVRIERREVEHMIAAVANTVPAASPAIPEHWGRSWCEAVVRIVVQVAEALAHVHARRIAHRDVKSSNILIDEVGNAHLIDFGLSRQEDQEHATLTRPGSEIGSLPYLPPERVRGAECDLVVQDVYSLGVTLFELLTGTLPFVGSDPDAVRRAITAGHVPSARTRNRAVDCDLDAICKVTMDPDPNRRYGSAAALAEDLRRFLDGRQVRARPVGPLVRAARWVRRHPVRAVAITAFGVLLAGGGFAWRLHRAGIEALRAVQADAYLARTLESEVEVLPALPEAVPALRGWLERYDYLSGNLPNHVASVAELRRGLRPVPDREADPELFEELRELARRRAGTTRYSYTKARMRGALAEVDEKARRLWWELREKRRWTFTDDADRSMHDVLVDIIALHAELEAREPDIRDRLAKAETLVQRSVEAHADGWREACARLASDLRFSGVSLQPQVGLVPLGPDPVSGLEEFAVLDTGTIPERVENAALQHRPGDALVLVLLPGGTARVGSEPPGTGAEHPDPLSMIEEQPVHEVDLDPFFLGKFEVTQAQWRCMADVDPSLYAAGFLTPGGREISSEEAAGMPVHGLIQSEALAGLARFGLELPTEAEWEYACRAGTKTPWWFGTEIDELVCYGNVSDERYRARIEESNAFDLAAGATLAGDDGYAVCAPVGSYPANGFGLHDVHGNVRELCADGARDYGLRPWASRGRGWSWMPRAALRGGGYGSRPGATRSSARTSVPVTMRSEDAGVRAALMLRH